MSNVLDKLTKPAFLATVSYIILAFMILLPFNMQTPEDVKNGEVRDTFASRLLIVFIMLIPIALSIYSINCMVVGGCHIWAWVQGIAIAFWVIIFIMASVIAADTSRNRV